MAIATQDKVLAISEWQTPATQYKEQAEGEFRIHRIVYPSKQYANYFFMDGYGLYFTEEELPITVLQELQGGEWQDWMVDDPPHYRAIQKYAEAAEGQVLVGGLGLGLIAHELAKNSKVTSITVVERSPEVCQLVTEYLPPHRLVVEDFWDFEQKDTGQWGMVFVDIWASKGKEAHTQLLHEKVIPAHALLRTKYPHSKIVFFGFQDWCDVPLVKPYFEVWSTRSANGTNS